METVDLETVFERNKLKTGRDINTGENICASKDCKALVTSQLA